MWEFDYVMVIHPPELPLKKSKPNKRLTVIMYGLMGLMLGDLCGVGNEKINDEKIFSLIVNLKELLDKNLKELISFRWIIYLLLF